MKKPDYRVAVRTFGVTEHELARSLADARDLKRCYDPHMPARDGKAWVEQREVGRWQRVD